MNNEDRYKVALRKDPLEAAELALDFSDGCSSRNRANMWADAAVEAAAKAGVTLDKGDLRWADTDAMRATLAAARGAR